MPVFSLSDEIVFPPPELAEESGLLAVGGDLNPDRLLLAYSMGIFPWYSKDDPILWWSPNPRMILLPHKMIVSKSLSQTIRKDNIEVKFDECFEQVIRHCATIKRREKGTWINEDMINAYIRLHNLGFAHSVETYINDRLAGGLYGISIGKAFYGESMFHIQRDASKVALYKLCERLRKHNFLFIDVQQSTDHLKSLGAFTISRTEFTELLEKALQYDTLQGVWRS